MNALAEQIVAVACLAHRVAVLSQLRGCGLIRVMDDSATGLSLNQQRLCWAGSTQFYSFTGFLCIFFQPETASHFTEGIHAAYGC